MAHRPSITDERGQAWAAWHQGPTQGSDEEQVIGIEGTTYSLIEISPMYVCQSSLPVEVSAVKFGKASPSLRAMLTMMVFILY